MNPIRQAIRVPKHGGPEVLQLVKEEISLAANLKPTHVLVQHKLAGVNYIDTYFRSGIYPPKPGHEFDKGGFVSGTEGVGICVQAGEAAQHLLGKLVTYFSCGVGQEGAYCTAAVHDANEVYECPSGIDLALACTLAGIQGCTAHYLSTDTYRVNSNSVVLLNAAAGGTGLLLSQMCKIRGAAKVIAICSGADKGKLAKELGKADVVIDRATTKDWVSEVLKIVPGGVDVFYDGAGKATFEHQPSCFTCLKPRGAMVTFGNASGVARAIQPLELSRGSYSLHRPKLNDYMLTAEERQQRIGEMLALGAEGKIKTVLTTMKLSQAGEAQALLESGATTGKLLLDCESMNGDGK